MLGNAKRGRLLTILGRLGYLSNAAALDLVDNIETQGIGDTLIDVFEMVQTVELAEQKQKDNMYPSMSGF